MTVAWDATDSLQSDTPSDPFEWTHTPVGPPKAVVVFFTLENTAVDKVVAITYGGVTMTRLQYATGPGNTSQYLYFLGTSIPTGAQTVSVDLTNTGSDVFGVSMSFTAAGDTESQDSDKLETTQTDPQITLQYGGNSCVAAAGLNSGESTPADLVVVAGTTASDEFDWGTTVSKSSYQTTAGTSDFTIGWTDAVSETTAMCAIAIKESAVPEEVSWASGVEI